MTKVYGQLARVVFTSMMLATIGCDGSPRPEASFELAADSRLPRWFGMPGNVNRSDFRLTITYYIDATGRYAVVVLSGRGLASPVEVKGTLRGLQPLVVASSTNQGKPAYPKYEVVDVEGVKEVLEHRGREPIVYVTDDSNTLRALGIIDN